MHIKDTDVKMEKNTSRSELTIIQNTLNESICVNSWDQFKACRQLKTYSFCANFVFLLHEPEQTSFQLWA